jgi:hypothetical protein
MLVINLRNTKLCTSPIHYIYGSYLVRRPPAYDLSFKVSSWMIYLRESSIAISRWGQLVLKPGFDEPLCLAGLLRQVMSLVEAALKLPVVWRLCTRGMV